MRSRTVTILCAAAVTIASNLASGQMVGKDAGTVSTFRPSSTVPHYSFEVISIHPSPPDGTYDLQRTADGIRINGFNIRSVLLLSYFPTSLWSQERLQNVPAWVNQNQYDIIAKVAPHDLDAWTHQSSTEPTILRAMLLSMLEDRCHLQMHTIPGEMPGFALAVSRHGTSLRPFVPGEALPEGMKLIDGGVATPEALEDGSTTWHFHNATMASLLKLISFNAHTRILDQTGLTGRYDFALGMVPEINRIDNGDIKDPASMWDLRALGLRTIPTKVPSLTLVIDHIEPPSEN